MDASTPKIPSDEKQAEDVLTEGEIISEPQTALSERKKPEVKKPDGKSDSEAQQKNQSVRYGRRMDYKTAKVSEGKETSSLNLSVPGSIAAPPIHNPLPTPKKRVPREMEFDIEPSMFEMHFDLVDLDGKDFFDIN